jgi:hypothetical protein
MRVINEHHQGAPPGRLGYRPAVPPQQLTTVLSVEAVAARVGRQKRSQRPERQRA